MRDGWGMVWLGSCGSSCARAVHAAITTQHWLGTWTNGHMGNRGDRLILTRSAEGRGKLHVEGRAYYTNIAHNTSSGEVSGDALAKGPFLHILDHGEMSGCVLDLTYDVVGGTFRAIDNQQCGGHNVTFGGVGTGRNGRISVGVKCFTS